MSSTQPSMIGRYEIVRRLGEGGMGAVYLARDPLIERQIAVKFLREGLENDELRERFVREARSAGRLQHVNIVVIYDVGEQAGRPYIAMEYVEGSTLGDTVRRRDVLPLTQKLRLLEQLCEGLAYAHRAGIVHRDIKPANLIVSRDGVLKILDFGIARLGRAGLTMAGVMLGTLNYMSPEQITGGEIDHRSDIFAVGSVCYELLSNTRAFPGDLQDGILHRILSNQPPALPTLVPGIDPRLVEVINKALEKEPARRYQDLEHMKVDLAEIRESLAPSTTAQARTFIAPSGPETVIQAPPPVPTAASTAQRTMSGREQATRFRAEQIEHWLDVARTAFERAAYDEAQKACQQVFVLDPDNGAAVELSDRARAAADERQMAAHLEDATALLSRGAIDDASRVIKLALALDPASPAAIRMRLAIDEARRAREQDQARRRNIETAMDGAESAFRATSYDTALRRLDEVLALDRTHDRARTLRDEVLDALEQRRQQKAQEEAVRGKVAEAWEWYDRGEHTAAFSLLDGVTPPHPLATTAANEMRRLQEASKHLATATFKVPGDSDKTVIAPAGSGTVAGPLGDGETLVVPVPTGNAAGQTTIPGFDPDRTVLVPPLPPRAARAVADPGATVMEACPPNVVPNPATSRGTSTTPPTHADVLATPASGSHPAAATPPTRIETAPVIGGAGAAVAPPTTSAKPGGGGKTLVVAAVVLLLMVGAGAAWYFTRPQPQPPSETTAQEPSAPSDMAATLAQPPSGDPSASAPSASPAAATSLPADTPGPAMTSPGGVGTPAPGTPTPSTAAGRGRRRTDVPTGPAPGGAATAQPASGTFPVHPPARGGVLVVESDSPGSAVYVDGQLLGTAPFRSSPLAAGEHEVRATLEGEDDIIKLVDVPTSGETAVFLRFKEVRLRTAIRVVHKHGMGGSCEGRLSATLAGLSYDTPNRNDAFSMTFDQLERFTMDVPNKTLSIKMSGGRTWNFTDRNPQPDELVRFHAAVTKARTKLAAQGR